MKIEILIPNTKHSERCPNKNHYLRHFTLEYLEHELEQIKEQCVSMWRGKNNLKVEVVELRNQKVLVNDEEDLKYKFPIRKVFCPDEVSHDMKPLLNWYDEETKADIIILLQLTQPKRRSGLLVDVINDLLKQDTRLVTSFVKVPFEEPWRVINATGDNWNEAIRNQNIDYLKLYDGAVYGFHIFKEPNYHEDSIEASYNFETEYQYRKRKGYLNSQVLWRHDRPKNLIENYNGQVIDIDYPEQLKQFLNTEHDLHNIHQ